MFRFGLNGLHRLASRTGIRLIACAAVLLFVPLLSSRESVRAELARLQDRGGYRLVAVRDNKIFTVSFADRTIKQSRPFVGKGTATSGTVSPDGARVAISLCLDPGISHPTPNESDCPSGFVLAIVWTDGSELRVYRDFANPGLAGKRVFRQLRLAELREGIDPFSAI